MSLCLVMCAKEYSFEGKLPAQFTIEGSPDVCNPVIIAGNYVEGVKADSSDYITLTLDVTMAGVYNITTTAVDGITFSANGNFSDTGRYTVNLYCSGTPASPGNYMVKVPGTNGCYFTLTINKKKAASYILTSTSGDCSNPIISGQYQQNIKTTIADSVVLQVNISAPGTYKIVTNNTNGFSFADSGFFYNTGIQNVTLHASGTPSVQGPVSFDVTADSSQCNFIVLVDPGLPQAVYVLESAMNQNIDYCTPQSIQGNYISGTALGASNTVTITVFVQTAGNYSIYTGKLNGISFVATGQFTTTGEQSVVLHGSGTPVASGDFLFNPNIVGPAPLGGQSCSFDIQVQ